MFTSTSTSSLGAPKIGLPPLGKGRSQSTPALQAAFNLREYSLSRHKIPSEKMPHLQVNQQPQRFDKIDVLGGNGRWRQRKAKMEWDRRAVEDKERSKEVQVLEEQRRARIAEMDLRRRRQQELDAQRHAEQQEQIRLELEEQERKRIEAELTERYRREAEEEERHRRAPKTCEKCTGSGVCKTCSGKGYTFATFLVSRVTEDTAVDYGRAKQGCEDCGGCRHNIVGDLKVGSGKCAECSGVGKIRPVLKVDTWNASSRRSVDWMLSPKLTTTEFVWNPGRSKRGSVEDGFSPKLKSSSTIPLS